MNYPIASRGARMPKAFWGLLLWCCASTVAWAQFDIPPKPSTAKAVYDMAELLSEDDANALNDKLVHYADSTSTQIVVAIVPTIHGDDMAQVATRWAQSWGIGQADKDNGVLVLIASEDHKYFTVPGYGLEDRMTAGQLGQLGRDVLVPAFKSGDFYGGLDAFTDDLIAMAAGKYKAEPEDEEVDGLVSILPIVVFFFIFILALIFRNRGGGRGGRGGRGGGMSIGDAIILSSLGRSSWGGGGSSGGGFGGGSFGGGFGGGGFSGGGAGGGW